MSGAISVRFPSKYDVRKDMSGKILAILSEIPNTGIIDESNAFRSIVLCRFTKRWPYLIIKFKS